MGERGGIKDPSEKGSKEFAAKEHLLNGPVSSTDNTLQVLEEASREKGAQWRRNRLKGEGKTTQTKPRDRFWRNWEKNKGRRGLGQSMETISGYKRKSVKGGEGAAKESKEELFWTW